MSRLFERDGRPDRTPVFVVTGFLGSGKTTLLNRLLRDPALADTAVIVNELGEAALDHLLVERLDGEVVLLASGCVCCAMRSDFEATLRLLLARRDEGGVPPFSRVVVETTGLADPAPLMQTVDANPLVSHFCTLGAVIATVDAVNAPTQLAAQWEARKQVALADTLLVTKRDLVSDTGALAGLLRSINPHAVLLDADALDDASSLLERRAPHAGVTDALVALRRRPTALPHSDVRSFALRADAPLDWLRLQAWLAELRRRQGDRLLRLKGIVSIEGESDPIVLHGVHHLFHPPVRAPDLRWPPGTTAIVLIGRGLDEAALSAGFDACR